MAASNKTSNAETLVGNKRINGAWKDILKNNLGNDKEKDFQVVIDEFFGSVNYKLQAPGLEKSILFKKSYLDIIDGNSSINTNNGNNNSNNNNNSNSNTNNNNSNNSSVSTSNNEKDFMTFLADENVSLKLHRTENSSDKGNSPGYGVDLHSFAHKEKDKEIFDSDLTRDFEAYYFNPKSVVKDFHYMDYFSLQDSTRNSKSCEISLSKYEDSKRFVGIPEKAYYSFTRKDEYNSIKSSTQEFYLPRLEHHSKEKKCKTSLLTLLWCRFLTFPRLMELPENKFHYIENGIENIVTINSPINANELNYRDRLRRLSKSPNWSIETEPYIYSKNPYPNDTNTLVLDAEQIVWNYDQYPTDVVLKVAKDLNININDVKNRVASLDRAQNLYDKERCGRNIYLSTTLQNQGIRFFAKERLITTDSKEQNCRQLKFEHDEKYDIFYSDLDTDHFSYLEYMFDESNVRIQPISTANTNITSIVIELRGGGGQVEQEFYEPTDEVSNNEYVYRNRDDKDKWLELVDHGSGRCKWTLKQTENKGSSTTDCFVYFDGTSNVLGSKYNDGVKELLFHSKGTNPKPVLVVPNNSEYEHKRLVSIQSYNDNNEIYRNPGVRYFMSQFVSTLLLQNMYLRILNNFLLHYVPVCRTLEVGEDIQLVPYIGKENFVEKEKDPNGYNNCKIMNSIDSKFLETPYDHRIKSPQAQRRKAIIRNTLKNRDYFVCKGSPGRACTHPNDDVIFAEDPHIGTPLQGKLPFDPEYCKRCCPDRDYTNCKRDVFLLEWDKIMVGDVVELKGVNNKSSNSEGKSGDRNTVICNYPFAAKRRGKVVRICYFKCKSDRGCSNNAEYGDLKEREPTHCEGCKDLEKDKKLQHKGKQGQMYEVKWDYNSGKARDDINAQYRNWLETRTRRGAVSGIENTVEFERRAAFFSLVLDFWFDFEPIMRDNTRIENQSSNSSRYIQYHPRYLARVKGVTVRPHILDVEFDKPSGKILPIGMPQLQCVFVTVHHVLSDSVSSQLHELQTLKKRHWKSDKTLISKVLIQPKSNFLPKSYFEECVDKAFLPFNLKLMQQPLFDLIRSSLKTLNRNNVQDMAKFRLLVNIWLMYVTPWNFDLSYREMQYDPAPDKKSANIYEKWEYYIAGNYHFYTTLLVMFLEFISAFNFVHDPGDKDRKFQSDLNFDYIRRIFDVFDARLIKTISDIYDHILETDNENAIGYYTKSSSSGPLNISDIEKARCDNYEKIVKSLDNAARPSQDMSVKRATRKILLQEVLLQHHNNVFSQTQLFRFQDNNDINDYDSLKNKLAVLGEYQELVECEFVKISGSVTAAKSCQSACHHIPCILAKFYKKMNAMSLSQASTLIKKSSSDDEESSNFISAGLALVWKFFNHFVKEDTLYFYDDIRAMIGAQASNPLQITASSNKTNGVIRARNKLIEGAVKKFYGPARPDDFIRSYEAELRKAIDSSRTDRQILDNMKRDIKGDIMNIKNSFDNCQNKVGFSAENQIEGINNKLLDTFADISKNPNLRDIPGFQLTAESATDLGIFILEEINAKFDSRCVCRGVGTTFLKKIFFVLLAICFAASFVFPVGIVVPVGLLLFVLVKLVTPAQQSHQCACHASLRSNLYTNLILNSDLIEHMYSFNSALRSYEIRVLAIVGRLMSLKLSKLMTFSNSSKIVFMCLIVANWLLFITFYLFDFLDESNEVGQRSDATIASVPSSVGNRKGKSKIPMLAVVLAVCIFYQLQGKITGNKLMSLSTNLSFKSNNSYFLYPFLIIVLLRFVALKYFPKALLEVFPATGKFIMVFIYATAFFAVVPTIYRKIVKPMVYLDLRFIADSRFYVAIILTLLCDESSRLNLYWTVISITRPYRTVLLYLILQYMSNSLIKLSEKCFWLLFYGLLAYYFGYRGVYIINDIIRKVLLAH